jgi:hypothetical protein
MTVVRILVILFVLIFGIGYLVRFLPGRSKLLLTAKEPHFPVVSGYNLDRQELEFPRDFAAKYNLVIVAFQQYHQNAVNTWIPYVQEVEAFHPSFMYYELPTIRSLPALSRSFINEGMRAGIPDSTARERTITLYLDKVEFNKALNISTEEEIHLFLVNKEGKILWRESGSYTEDKANDLVESLQKLEVQNNG